MVKIIVANSDIKQNLEFCQLLFNFNNNFKIIQTDNGLLTIEQYYKEKPDILILNTNLKDKNYIDIIDDLSKDSNEKRNCNILLISDISNEVISITNVAKIYKIFTPPYTTQDIFNTIVELSNIELEKNIDLLFIKLHIHPYTIASEYIKYALIKCYHYPLLLNNFNDILELLSKHFDKDTVSIKSSIRSALKTLNIYRDNNSNIPFKIFNLFPQGENITPKTFFEVATFYLRNMKV